jgi:hypothetical protein
MKKIIFLDTDTFDSTLRLGSHHYAKLFKENGWDVLWLAQCISPFSFISKRNSMARIKAFHSGLQKSPDDIFYYTAFTLLPYLNIKSLDNLWFAKHSLKFTVPLLKNILAETGFSTVDILFVNNIKLISIIDLIKIKEGIVTRIPDNISGFSHHPANIEELEKFVVKMSKIVLCTTNNILEKTKSFNRNSYLLPNGVDYQKFTGVYEKPVDLEKIPGKKVIYVGAIGDWFDFEFLAYACKEMKNTSFVIIGPFNSRIKNFIKDNKFNNLHYLGPRDYEVVPSYVSNCDCGIIPFKVNKLTNDVSPIKMFEYLASGIPVVSSGISQVKAYSKAVYIYNDKNEFVNSIQTALNESKEKKIYRLSIARENSWQARFEKIINLINQNPS